MQAMSNILYHGTSSRRFRKIVEDGEIRPAPFGDKHVSLSRSRDIAMRFAELACDADECDYGEECECVVFEFDEAKLRAEFTLSDFESVNAYDDEQEVACLEAIPVSYVVRLERGCKP